MLYRCAPALSLRFPYANDAQAPASSPDGAKMMTASGIVGSPSSIPAGVAYGWKRQTCYLNVFGAPLYMLQAYSETIDVKRGQNLEAETAPAPELEAKGGQDKF